MMMYMEATWVATGGGGAFREGCGRFLRECLTPMEKHEPLFLLYRNHGMGSQLLESCGLSSLGGEERTTHWEGTHDDE